MTQSDKTKIHLAYIETSNGPWILIFGSMLSDFSPLISLFDDLSTGKKQYCELHSESYIIPHGGIEVTIQSFSNPKRISDLHQTKAESLVFIWNCETEILEDSVEKIAYLADASDSGHQYIFSKASCKTLVVVSKGEYTDDIQFLLE